MLNKTIRRAQRIGIVIVTLFLLASFAVAQTFNFEEEWRWAHFTTESGLPSNQIIDFLEDNNGMLWVCTPAGIAWFDGFRWNEIDRSKELPNESPIGISLGIGDSITVRYSDKVYTGTKNGFTQIPNITFTQIITYHEGKYIYHGANGILFEYENGNSKPIMYSVSQAYYTKAKRFWFFSDSGLYIYSHRKIVQTLLTRDNYIQSQMYGLAENRLGECIIAIMRPPEMSGIWELNSSGSFHHIKSEREGTVVCLDINDRGDVLCIYESGNIRLRQKGIWSSPRYIPQQLRQAQSIKFTSQGDLWVRTNHGISLFRATTKLWAFRNHDIPGNRDNINEILRRINGEIWLGTGDGIIIYEPDGDERWISNISGTPLFAITGLAQDQQGNIWISSGSSFPGTYRWNGTEWKHFFVGDNPNNTMIHKIKKDRKGNLWFLGIAKQASMLNTKEPGAYLLRETTFVPWTAQHSFNNQRIYSFAESRDGSYWFGTNRGIFQWKPDRDNNLKNEALWKNWGTNQGLKYLRVLSLAIDDSGTVWFGHGTHTEPFGIGKISRSGKVEYLTVKEGLVENSVKDLFIEPTGALWITTNGGVSNYKNGVFTNFTEHTGLESQYLWPIQAFSDYVLVGTLGKGLAIMNRAIPLSPPPIVQLNRPIIDGNSAFLLWRAYAFRGELPFANVPVRYRLNNEIWSPWSTARNLTLNDLPPNSYTFQVQARGIYGQYLETGGYTSFVILPPLWVRPIFFIPVGIVALAFFTLVIIYINKKIASDAALRKSEEKFRAVAETTPSALFIYTDNAIVYANPASIALTGFSMNELLLMNFAGLMHPRFQQAYQSANGGSPNERHSEVKLLRKDKTERWIELTTSRISFEGKPATLAAVFDITDRKQSELQLRALTFELSRTEERERRRLATYLHDTIGQNLAFLKLKLRSFSKLPNDANYEQPTTEIKEIVESLIQDSQTLTFELSPPILNELGFEAALEWLAERFQERHAIRCKTDFTNRTTTLPHDIQSMLFNAIRELMTNVVKHAQATEILILVNQEHDKLTICVDDNGTGFVKKTSGSHLQQRGGFGLFNIRQRIASLGGSLEAQSREKGGSSVCITLPITFSEITYGQ